MNNRKITIHNYRKKKAQIHSSANKYGTNKKDYVIYIDNNVFYVNFKSHGDFINLQNQRQTDEPSLPAWLAD